MAWRSSAGAAFCSADARFDGTLAAPLLYGELNLKEGEVQTHSDMVTLSKLVTRLKIEGNRAELDGSMMVGKGPLARSVRLQLPRFTLVGATTRLGLMTSPLRARFGIVEQLDLYSPEDLTRIVTRGAEVLGVDIDEDASLEIGRRARGTPRVALRLLRRVRDVAAVSGSDRIRRAVACSALDMLGVDPEGLDDGDRKLLRAVVDLFDGGPVGLSTLAAALNEDTQTIEDIYEPFLIQKGFLERTPRGRKATRGTFAYLGMEPTVRFRQLALLEGGE